MNIFIDGIIYSLQKYGGISVYFDELIKYARSINASGSVLVHDPRFNQLVENSSGLDVIFRKSRLLERYLACRVNQADCIFHSSYYRIPSDIRLPTVVTVHDFVYERYKSGIPRFVHSVQKNNAIRNAQAIICVSEATRDDLFEYFGEMPGKTVHVIHNGVSEKFFPIHEKCSAEPYILFVGQRGGYKNFELILNAMPFLPGVKLYCVGGGALKSDELSSVSNNVIERVKHCGFVQDDELNKLYNNAICLVYPSLYEGFGIPVIEAMRAGCPVVCVKCKAVLEVGGEALTVIDDDDPRTLAAEIINISMSSRVDKIQLGFSISKQYSWRKTHERTFEVYSNMS